jgi:hypothetical protein
LTEHANLFLHRFGASPTPIPTSTSASTMACSPRIPTARSASARPHTSRLPIGSASSRPFAGACSGTFNARVSWSATSPTTCSPGRPPGSACTRRSRSRPGTVPASNACSGIAPDRRSLSSGSGATAGPTPTPSSTSINRQDSIQLLRTPSPSSSSISRCLFEVEPSARGPRPLLWPRRGPQTGAGSGAHLRIPSPLSCIPEAFARIFASESALKRGSERSSPRPRLRPRPPRGPLQRLSLRCRHCAQTGGP